MSNGSSFFMRIQMTGLASYGLAFLVTACALILARVLEPFLGPVAFYSAAFPAIAFSAWCCGLGPSIGASLFTLVAIRPWFVLPGPAFAKPTGLEILGMVMFLAAAALIVFMGESRRRQNSALRVEHGELEVRVRQRTMELDTANKGLRDLTARLLQSQDEERRRIARELHDSIGQILAALSMNLTTVLGDIERFAATGKKLSDSMALVQEMNKEIRTVSYLLHPPLLDEAGLASALRWYVDGFSTRSGISVDLDVEDYFGRLPRELETAMFRMVQECLTNIHRHSGGSLAQVQLSRSNGEVRLRVDDNGVGMPVEKLTELKSQGSAGVGVRGMRERIRQLGGNLDIRSSENGTVVEARLPVAVSTTTAAA